MGVWISESALQVIISALQEAAEARLARVDGSCADCTDDTICVDHACDVDSAMRYYDALGEIAEGIGAESSRVSSATITPKCSATLWMSVASSAPRCRAAPEAVRRSAS